MKKSLMACLVAFGMNVMAQNPISPYVVGQNANLTAKVGTLTTAGGKLDRFWQKTGVNKDSNYVGFSHTTFIRYGGILLEKYSPLDGAQNVASSNFGKVVQDYVEKATAIFANGQEPALTMPMHPDWDESSAPGNSDTLFTNIGNFMGPFVRSVNDTLQARLGKVCRYWIYSNEPQLPGGFHGYTTAIAPKRIHDYIASMYNSVSAVWQTTWNATPEFVGPELAGLDNYNHGNGLNRLTEQLLGVWPNTNNSIKPYITVFSWHDYPYNDQNSPSGDFPKPTDTNAIRTVAHKVTVPNGFPSFPVVDQIDSVKKWLGTGSTIKMAITEYNITHKNRVSSFDAINYNSDSLHRQGANSFMAAQYNAEYLSYCMEKGVHAVNMWSALEGCGTCTDNPNYVTNVGYLNADPARTAWGIGGKKPSYYSYQMMGLLRGEFYRGSSKSFKQYDSTGIYAQYQNGVKVFGAVEAAGIRIICINHTDSAFDYRVKFKSSAGNANGRASFDFTNMLSSAYLGGFSTPANDAYNGADVIPANSIVLLQFDCHGGFMTQRNYSYYMADNNQGPQLRVIGPVVLNYDVLNCDDIEPGTGLGGYINSTDYYKDTLYVTEDLHLNPGATVRFDSCLVVMSPGKGIYGGEGNVIELENTVMVGCNQSDWQGITMVGFNIPSEKFSMKNSFIVGATHPVNLTRIANIDIRQSVMVSGITAIELDQCQKFTITQNIMACYETAAIKTSNTAAGYRSYITMNQMWEIFEGFHSENDMHDSLTYGCNDTRFSSAGVYAMNSTIADQGNSMISAGNNFYNNNSTEPTHYWDQTGGNSPKYYYGPMNAIEFGYFSPMSITTQTAMVDPLCAMLFVNDCPEWQVPLGVKKNGTIMPEMSVYPNPSNGAFTIELKDNQEKYLMSVYDIMGRLLESREVDFSQENSVRFEIKTRGMYIVNLSNEKTRVTKKVIVQ